MKQHWSVKYALACTGRVSDLVNRARCQHFRALQHCRDTTVEFRLNCIGFPSSLVHIACGDLQALARCVKPRREWPSGAESVHASDTERFKVAVAGVARGDFMCTNFESISHWKVYLEGLLAGPTTDLESIAAVVHDEFVDRELPEAVHWRSMDLQLVERGNFAVVKRLTSQLRVSLDVTHSLSPRLSGMVFLLGRTRQRAVPRVTARSFLDWRRFVCPQHTVGEVKLISPSFTKCVSIHCVRTRC